jgi:RimJ/RimL family protein N-acetyltransferase
MNRSVHGLSGAARGVHGHQIGERDYWGKGYGTDALRVLLRYAFDELNLHRVSLSVLEGNERAMRSYQKCGFRYEGRQRQVWAYDGRRWDEIYMGLLRDEWHALNNVH